MRPPGPSAELSLWCEHLYNCNLMCWPHPQVCLTVCLTGWFSRDNGSAVSCRAETRPVSPLVPLSAPENWIQLYSIGAIKRSRNKERAVFPTLLLQEPQPRVSAKMRGMSGMCQRISRKSKNAGTTGEWITADTGPRPDVSKQGNTGRGWRQEREGNEAVEEGSHPAPTDTVPDPQLAGRL